MNKVFARGKRKTITKIEKMHFDSLFIVVLIRLGR